jgi:anti-anti-sigma factor
MSKMPGEYAMIIRAMRENDAVTLNLEGGLDIGAVSLFQDALVHAFTASNRVTLDFRNVAHVSPAGLLALLVGQKTADSVGVSMMLSAVPESIMDAFEETDLLRKLTIV